MKDPNRRRNRLTPWYIGLGLVAAAIIFVGLQFAQSDCGAPGPVIFMVLAVIPIVYLVLMYLTLTSQE